MRGSRGSHDAAVTIEQHGPRAACPDINSQKLHRRHTLLIRNKSRRAAASTAPSSHQQSDRPPPSSRFSQGFLCALCASTSALNLLPSSVPSSFPLCSLC